MIWIIHGDSILCDASQTPYLLQVEKPPKSAVPLQFVETHSSAAQGAVTSHSPFSDSAFILAEYAMRLDAALELGYLVAYGDGYDTKNHKDLRLLSFRQLATNVDCSASLAHISRAIELILWDEQNVYCGHCGTKTHRHPQGEHAKICPKCHQRAYPKIQPCVITAVVRTHPQTQRTQILLAQHHRHKHSGMHGLIAGFIEAGESVEQAVHREVLEEVGLKVENLRYFGSQSWPYPSNLMLGFLADYLEGEIRVQANELMHAEFFDLDDLPQIPPVGSIAYQLIQYVKDSQQNSQLQ